MSSTSAETRRPAHRVETEVARTAHRSLDQHLYLHTYTYIHGRRPRSPTPFCPVNQVNQMNSQFMQVPKVNQINQVNQVNMMEEWIDGQTNKHMGRLCQPSQSGQPGQSVKHIYTYRETKRQRGREITPRPHPGHAHTPTHTHQTPTHGTRTHTHTH